MATLEKIHGTCPECGDEVDFEVDDAHDDTAYCEACGEYVSTVDIIRS